MAEGRLSRTEYAYRFLTGEVLRGRWDAGETLSTYALSEELGISRTPVAEALKRLEGEGLVEIIPQVGSRIVRPDPGPVADLFALRAALEGVAAAAAARNITDTQLSELELTLRRLERAAANADRSAYDELYTHFHVRLVQAAAIPQLVDAARSIWTPLRYRLAGLPLAGDQLIESVREHRELYAALEQRSAERARTAAEGHVRRAAARFLVPLGPGRSGGLAHHALIYADEEEFLASTVPFVALGLQAGERVLAVTTPTNRELLTRALDRRAEEVEFRDSDEWYELPSHTLLSYQRYIQYADRDRVRVIGEVAWNDNTPAALAEWTRYEAVVNVAFALAPVSIICPYDARRLPSSVVADAHRTHPAICHGAESSPSENFTDVAVLTRELDQAGFGPPSVPVATHSITPDLRGTREFILTHARRAGVSGKAFQDAFLAAQEVAASVIFHGPGLGTISAWVENGELIYEITDHGGGSSDPLAGQLVLDPVLMSEPRGLWLARLLCDLVEARTHNGGLMVRLHIAAPST
jgi:GntR family transcriptional regulator, rspAB operon transcriptional repressor